MGHVSGIATMGGVYDKTPEIHEDVIEREYEKLEPYINIYSSSVGVRRTDLEREVAELRKDRDALREIADVLRDPEKMRRFKKMFTE